MANRQYLVLVGTDYSAHGWRAVRAAAREAAKHPYAKLHIVHVVPDAGAALPRLPFTGLAGAAPPASSDAALRLLDDHVARALAAVDLPEGNTLVTQVVKGDPVAVLLDLAWGLQANILVVGTPGRKSLERWTLGRVAETVVRQATCAVIVIGPRVLLNRDYEARLAPS